MGQQKRTNGEETGSHSDQEFIEPTRRHIPEPQFPIYYPVATSPYRAAIYCRSLMSSGNGFPLWRVSSSTISEENLQYGVGIGDVGHVGQMGEFVYWFNIFYPRDHPRQGGDMPRNFRHIEPPLAEWRVQVTTNYYEPGTILSSEGISITRISDHPLEVKFASYAREGAVLVLPEGVTREDLVESHKLYSYLKEQASDWYQFANAYSDVPLLAPQVNSSLFVVTGIDRAKIWNIAHFPPVQSELSRPTIFHYTQDQESGRSWESKNKTRMDWSDEMATNAEGKFPSAIFFRGISIALSRAAWTHGISPIPISHLPVYFVPSVPAYGKRADIERFIQRLRPGIPRSKIHNKEAIFHPAFVFSQILLEIDSGAEVALVEDSIWCPFMNGRSLYLPELIKLVHRILDKYDITTEDGVVHFTPKEHVELTVKQKLQSYIQLLTTGTTRPSKERIALRKLKRILSKPCLTDDSD